MQVFKEQIEQLKEKVLILYKCIDVILFKLLVAGEINVVELVGIENRM